VLLVHSAQPVDKLVGSRAFWDDADVRWLTGVNESGGKTYFNQEATDELLMWMMLPSLLQAAASQDPEQELPRIETVVSHAREAGRRSGFELEKLLTQGSGSLKQPAGGGALDAQDLVDTEDAPDADAEPRTKNTKSTRSATDSGSRSGR
jgi:hypothetical protein